MAAPQTTDRGFGLYCEIEDTRGCQIRVVESSIVGRPCAWIFTVDVHNVYRHDGNANPHMNVDQVKALIAGLQAFVDDVEDPEHWRNDPDYKATWWEDEGENGDAGS